MRRPAVRPAPAILALSLAWAFASAQAQEQGAQAVGLRIVPLFDVGLSVVNSNLQTPQGAGYARSGDIVTQLRPGIEINGRLGRTQLNLSYALDVRRHSRPYPGINDGDGLQNALNATLATELVDRWLFLDASALISQQSISAFGQQSADGTQYNTNRTESAQYSLRPYARGAIGDLATYRLGLTAETSQYRSALAPDSTSTNASLELASPNQGALIGWGLAISALRADYTGGASSDNQRVSFSLLARPDPDYSASLRAGRESTKIGSAYDASSSNWGGELRWTPSPRTSASFGMDERYFGRAHQASFEHRMASTSIRFGSSRDAINGAGVGGGAGQSLTQYQLFAPLFSSITDPALRDQKIREFLAELKRDPNQVTPGSYVNRGASVLRRDDLSITYSYRRTTLSVQVFRNQTSRLGVAADAVDAEPIRQDGWTSTVTYRLTPTSSLLLTSSRSATQSTSTLPGNRLRWLSLNWSDQLARLITVSVYARYSAFDGSINPYHESSLGASLGLRF